MEKCYKGHLWTRTMTTNISNTFGLTFHYSHCVELFQCHNQNWTFLELSNCAIGVNEVEFEGITNDPFCIKEVRPTSSTLVVVSYLTK